MKIKVTETIPEDQIKQNNCISNSEMYIDNVNVSSFLSKYTFIHEGGKRPMIYIKPKGSDLGLNDKMKLNGKRK